MTVPLAADQPHVACLRVNSRPPFRGQQKSVWFLPLTFGIGDLSRPPQVKSSPPGQHGSCLTLIKGRSGFGAGVRGCEDGDLLGDTGKAAVPFDHIVACQFPYATAARIQFDHIAACQFPYAAALSIQFDHIVACKFSYAAALALEPASRPRKAVAVADWASCRGGCGKSPTRLGSLRRAWPCGVRDDPGYRGARVEAAAAYDMAYTPRRWLGLGLTAVGGFSLCVASFLDKFVLGEVAMAD